MIKLDFPQRIKRLRFDEDHFSVRDYESEYGFVPPSLDSQSWYQDYLIRFNQYCEHFCQPEALPDTFEREVLFAMICGSFIVEIEIVEADELFQKERVLFTYEDSNYDPYEGISTTRKYEFYFDELNEEQIDFFYNRFIEEQLDILTAIADLPEDVQDKSRNSIVDWRSKALDFIRNAVTGDCPIPRKRPPFRHLKSGLKTTYHYTSISTLEAILKGNSLRASDVRKLNDKKELSIWFDVFESAFSRFRQKKNYYTYEKELTAIRTKVYEKKKKYYYSISLSGASDLLSQWNLYGDRCKGVCIAFYADILKRIMKSRGVDYFELTYDFEGLSWEIYKTICNYLQSINQTEPSESDYESLADRIFHQMRRMKDPSFFAEKESRFMCSRERAVRHCFMRKGQKVHYRDFHITGNLPIAGIMLGPCVEDVNNVILRINTLLKETGYENVPVSVSSIPFRA